MFCGHFFSSNFSSWLHPKLIYASQHKLYYFINYTFSAHAVDPAIVDMEMDSMYFCGNSLGLQPKESRTLVIQELDKWQKMYIIIFLFLS